MINFAEWAKKVAYHNRVGAVAPRGGGRRIAPTEYFINNRHKIEHDKFSRMSEKKYPITTSFAILVANLFRH